MNSQDVKINYNSGEYSLVFHRSVETRKSYIQGRNCYLKEEIFSKIDKDMQQIAAKLPEPSIKQETSFPAEKKIDQRPAQENQSLMDIFFNVFSSFSQTLSELPKKIESLTSSPVFIAAADLVTRRLKKNLDYAQKQQHQQQEIPDPKLTGEEKKRQIAIAGKMVTSFKLENNGRPVFLASSRGKRATMEDAHTCSTIRFTINGKEHVAELYGIFDGHGGKKASKFVANNFASYLKKALEKYHTGQLSQEGIWTALRECCRNLHNDYSGDDGTTATVAVILEDNIWVANVGDSRTVLNEDGTTVQLSEDAKLDPNDPENRYVNTVQKLGGKISRRTEKSPWRAQQGETEGYGLSVARAIGDKEAIGISHSPKITCYPLPKKGTNHLILACDGVWDVETSSQATYLVNKAEKHKKNPATVLAMKALIKGSNDNISALVVRL